MTVRRKPTAAASDTGDIEQFINAGGSEPEQPQRASAGGRQASQSDKVQNLKLRLPVDLLEEVDALVAQRRPAPSRHQWILEAIYEKVEREQETN